MSYPADLLKKINDLKEEFNQQVEALANEYSHIISAKKIKKEILGRHSEKGSRASRPSRRIRTPQSESPTPESSTTREPSDALLNDKNEHFKSQCKKIYELAVKLYREDGIHVLAYCVPSPEEDDIRPLKVFNTKLCKRFNSKLTREMVKLTDELKSYIAFHTGSKVTKETENQEVARSKRSVAEAKNQEVVKPKRSVKEAKNQKVARPKRSAEKEENQEAPKTKQPVEEVETQEVARTEQPVEDVEIQEVARPKRSVEEVDHGDDEDDEDGDDAKEEVKEPVIKKYKSRQLKSLSLMLRGEEKITGTLRPLPGRERRINRNDAFKRRTKPKAASELARFNLKKDIRKRLLDMLRDADPELDETAFPWKSFGDTGTYKTCVMEGLPTNLVNLSRGLDRMTGTQINILMDALEKGSIKIKKIE
ncbi:hypothetical protein G6F70_002871 [Rhizopus microsporus]|uniref:Uncharacterized protein n=2 Tax=Rhizopus TaxID=4842 RepID=A0A367J0W3_RHIAZ|nr:hypothetical protein G6F71_002805 [Rhizopus microsporus]RCH83573.1 hypothetical protein CU097_004125 [Rhizopus azygosporus]KAG1201774.1 hypothetical protein G6F70_002871 [Rhizopus microsporus]KAG1214602.1 hypothetical protein G6F69_001768 [Rhizopus microsporus]KAG1235898.1 hypothetical protein G6F67_002393 [Rhizopus microsporus]